MISGAGEGACWVGRGRMGLGVLGCAGARGGWGLVVGLRVVGVGGMGVGCRVGSGGGGRGCRMGLGVGAVVVRGGMGGGGGGDIDEEMVVARLGWWVFEVRWWMGRVIAGSDCR